MSIELIRLNRKSPDYKSVKRLYKSAFPADEKAPFGLLMRKLKGIMWTFGWHIAMING